MKIRALRVLACLALCFALASPVYATESDVTATVNGTTAESGVTVTVNGTAIEAGFTSQVLNNQTYVSYNSIVTALYPDAVAVWANNQAEVTAAGLKLCIKPEASYIVANGRYLYVPQGVKVDGYHILVPVRTLCQALGASVEWDGTTSTISITSGTGPIASGESFYDADDLYWLSRIINAESGNQSLQGKIAVGNVVLNRVASTRFPNSVYDVVFQRNQFTPASSGTIKRTPNEESVIAAKLCLDGANTVGDALFFVNPRVSPNSWASRNCTYVATIGAHAFFA